MLSESGESPLPSNTPSKPVELPAVENIIKDGDQSQGSLMDVVSEPKPTERIIYKGIEIQGLQRLEQEGILQAQDVTKLLDRLPEAYFDWVPVSAIVFEPYKLFSVERNGQTLYLREDELLLSDRIIARKRGESTWNSREEEGRRVATDGKMTIHIDAPDNWDDKQDKALDKNVTLYTLAHEIGHTTWGAIMLGPALWENMKQKGMVAPQLHPNIQNLVTAVNHLWKTLPPSQLPRFIEYSSVFIQDAKINRASPKAMENLTKEEDFAISHEYYLYWQNLLEQDPERHETIEDIYQLMQRYVRF